MKVKLVYGNKMRANGSFCTFGPALPRTRITTSTWLAAVQQPSNSVGLAREMPPYLLADEMETRRIFDTRVSST